MEVIELKKLEDLVKIINQDEGKNPLILQVDIMKEREYNPILFYATNNYIYANVLKDYSFFIEDLESKTLSEMTEDVKNKIENKLRDLNCAIDEVLTGKVL